MMICIQQKHEILIHFLQPCHIIMQVLMIFDSPCGQGDLGHTLNCLSFKTAEIGVENEGWVWGAQGDNGSNALNK